jgi:hypothetical protein
MASSEAIQAFRHPGTRQPVGSGLSFVFYRRIFTAELCSEYYVVLKLFGLLCDIVVRVSGCRTKGPEFDSRPYQLL